MKNTIDLILSTVESQENYILENTDYTSNYDVLLADDSSYHNDNWSLVITKAIIQSSKYWLFNNATKEKQDDIIDQLIEYIVQDPNGVCDISVKKYYDNNEFIIASFPIGEHEEYCIHSSTFANGICEYLNKNSDYYFKAYNNDISAYINLSDCFVAYTLQVDPIVEQFESILESILENTLLN